MSVTLEEIIVPQKPIVSLGSPHEYEQDIHPVLILTKEEKRIVVMTHIYDGFLVDGASIPFLFQWFLPRWAEEYSGNPFAVNWADIYNVGSSIHDGFYIHQGFGIFTREECDDILRGIWRQSGISRFKAGVADKAVEWFAGGNKHWGNDSYHVKEFFKIDVERG